MPPPTRGNEPLVDDAGECGGELHAHLGLLLAGEDVDHPRKGLCRVVGVQGGEDQVAGFGDGEGEADRVEVAHLADEHDVGVLAQRRAQRVAGNEAVSVPTSRWLTADRLCRCTYSIGSSIVMMWQARFGVDPVDHRGQGRRFARAGRAGDQDQALVLSGEVSASQRQAELCHGRVSRAGSCAARSAVAPRWVNALPRMRASLAPAEREVVLTRCIPAFGLRHGEQFGEQ